jgi:hypothetical protein
VRLAAAGGERTIGAYDLLDVKVRRADRAKILVKNADFAGGGFAAGCGGALVVLPGRTVVFLPGWPGG